MSESLEHLERLRDLGLSSWEEAQEYLIVWKCLQGGWKEDRAQWWDQRQWHRLEPSEHQEAFLYCENDQTLAQVAQGYRVSATGDIPKPSGQLLLSGPTWAGRLVCMTFTGPFQLQLFYRSPRVLMHMEL